MRVHEGRAKRQAQLAVRPALVATHNDYLTAHPRAAAQGAWQTLGARATTLRLSAWGELTLEERSLPLTVKVSAPHEAATLDGGSVRTTDRKPSQAPKEMVHDRYKALASVARALRACKTIPLAVRPLCLRLEERTRPLPWW